MSFEERKIKEGIACKKEDYKHSHDKNSLTYVLQAGDDVWIPKCEFCGWIDTKAMLAEYKEELLSKMPNIVEMPVDFENEARKLPREQIFMAGQLNMLMRLNEIIKES